MERLGQALRYQIDTSLTSAPILTENKPSRIPCLIVFRDIQALINQINSDKPINFHFANDVIDIEFIFKKGADLSDTTILLKAIRKYIKSSDKGQRKVEIPNGVETVKYGKLKMVVRVSRLPESITED